MWRPKLSENFPTLRWITRQSGVQLLIASIPWPNLGEPKTQVRMMPKASRNAQSISAFAFESACYSFRLPRTCGKVAGVRARRLLAVSCPRRRQSSIARTRMDWRSQGSTVRERHTMRLTGMPPRRPPIHAGFRAAFQKWPQTANRAASIDPSRVSRRAAQICRGKSASTV